MTKRIIAILALTVAFICTTARANTLTSLHEVAETCRSSSGAETNTFDVEAKVISCYRGAEKRLWILSALDGTNDVTIHEIEGAYSDFGDDNRPHLNDTIRFKGEFYYSKNAFHAGYRSANLVRRGTVDHRNEISAADVNAPDPRHDVVRLRGVVRDAARDETDPKFIYMTLNSSGSLVHAMINTFDNPSMAPTSLIGRNVAIDGLIYTPCHVAHRYSGRYVNVCGLANVHIGESFSAVNDTIPDISTIGHIQPQDIVRLGCHRAIGTVRAVWTGNHILLETDTGETVFAKILSSSLPACGDRVAVTGFPETDTFFLHLDNATWSAANGTPLPWDEPQDFGIGALTKNSRGIPHIDIRFNGKTIRFAGDVRFKSTGENSAIHVESEGHLVTVDLSPLANNIPDIKPGSRISIAGVYIVNAERTAFGNSVPKARGFFIVPRTADDVVIVSRPPWWTIERLVLVICLLVAAIAVVITWNIALARRSEKRGRELAEERIERVASELKTEERTHLAVELHDALSQTLAGISLKAGAANEYAKDSPLELRRHLRFVINAIDACRKELKNCLWDLRNQALEEKTMDEAIRKTLCQNLGADRISIRFAVPREALTDKTAHDILRTIRELVANAVRHGHAKHISVAGCIENGKMLFSVRDDGRGFDPDNMPGIGDGHFGIQGIRERVAAYGGSISVESAPGKGARISVSLNLIHTNQLS